MFFCVLGVKVSSSDANIWERVGWDGHEVSRRCQEGVKEVSSRVSLEGYLQEVVYDGLIGTE